MLQTQEHLVSSDFQRNMLLYVIIVMIIIVAFIIVFFVVFQKRKNKLLIKQFKQQQEFENEIAETRIEIQELTLKTVGQELHDNVGQMLAFTKLQIASLSALVHDEVLKLKIEDAKSVLSDSIQEVRSLSKSLNSDVIANFGLLEALKNEADRCNSSEVIFVNLIIKGEVVKLKDIKHELVLYRIIQEFLSNTLKYARATEVTITLNYQPHQLDITVFDNGIGFKENEINKGSGLINMSSRAEMIDTTFSLKSRAGEGTELHLQYNL